MLIGGKKKILEMRVEMVESSDKAVADFIRRRLFDMDRISETGCMVVNNYHVNRELERDAKAVRQLLKLADDMERNAIGSGSLNGVGDANNMRRIIASRWRDHKDFNRAWLW